MFGFLFIGAVAGVTAIAVPVAIHLLSRRKQDVQEVPSLMLFTMQRRRSRSFRMNDLLLLLIRAAIVGCLALLLAQPYLDTEVALPLPLAAGEELDTLHLGIVIDDSVTALPAHNNASRLDHSRDWLRSQLAALPDNTLVTICPTSFPYPTRFMDPIAATEALEKMVAVPKTGNAHAAITALQQQLAGRKRTCLLVAAPRSPELWRNAAPPSQIDTKPQPIFFFDTSEIKMTCYIANMERATGNLKRGNWRCQLAGTEEEMAGQSLTIGTETTKTTDLTFRLSPHDALSGALNMHLPPAGLADRAAVARLQTDNDHPWHHWYFIRSGGASATYGAIALVRQPTPAGLTAEKIITAAIRSVHPDITIHHLDGTKNAPVLEGVSAIVVIGNPPTTTGKWLQKQVTQGVRLISVPEDATGTNANHAHTDMLPSWGKPLPQHATGVESAAAAHLLNGIDELMLAGLAKMDCGPLVDSGSKETEVILNSSNGQPLIQTRMINQSTRLFSMALICNMEPNSPVFDPTFPLLISKLVVDGKATNTMSLAATVGDSVNLADWLGLDALDGVLTMPDGSTRTLQNAIHRRIPFNLRQAGIYRFDGHAKSSIQAVNYPRPSNTPEISTEAFTSENPNLAINWPNEDTAITTKDFRAAIGTVDRPDIKNRYDTTGFVIAFLMLFLAFEGVLLIRRKTNLTQTVDAPNAGPLSATFSRIKGGN